MNEFLSTRIYLRTNRANKQGEMPIYFRFTLRGERKEMSSNIYTTVQNWDKEQQKIKGKSEESRTKNSLLETLKYKVNQTQVNLTMTKGSFTINDFLQALIGKTERVRTIVPIFQDHNDRIKALIGIDYSKETHQIYQRLLRHLIEFMSHQYGLQDIAINKIDNAFVADYDFYLRTKRKISNNTTIKYIKNFKKIIRICIANGWLSKDPFLNYKAKLTQVERNYLTQEELKTIAEKEIKIERLDLVRDLFLFSCFTGLAYIDVKQLTIDNIIKGIDGNNWIYTHRQKTDTQSKIPLLEIPNAIIEKYKNHPKCDNEGTLLPMLSNQKMNAYLKEIADICHINKLLTFHCARHTFATTVTLSNGVPIESVSKMLGHKNIKMTQHYAKITDNKVAYDMSNLKSKLETTEIKNIKIS